MHACMLMREPAQYKRNIEGHHAKSTKKSCEQAHPWADSNCASDWRLTKSHTCVATMAAPPAPASASGRQRYLVKHWLAFTRGSGRPATSYTCAVLQVNLAQSFTIEAYTVKATKLACSCLAATKVPGKCLLYYHRKYAMAYDQAQHMLEVISICVSTAAHVLLLTHSHLRRGAPCLLKELRGVQAAGVVARLRLRAPRHARPNAQPACTGKKECVY